MNRLSGDIRRRPGTPKQTPTAMDHVAVAPHENNCDVVPARNSGVDHMAHTHRRMRP